MTRKWFYFYSTIATGLYLLAIYIDWKAALLGIFATIFTTAVNNTWKDRLKKEDLV